MEEGGVGKEGREMNQWLSVERLSKYAVGITSANFVLSRSGRRAVNERGVSLGKGIM